MPASRGQHPLSRSPSSPPHPTDIGSGLKTPSSTAIFARLQSLTEAAPSRPPFPPIFGTKTTLIFKEPLHSSNSTTNGIPANFLSTFPYSGDSDVREAKDPVCHPTGLWPPLSEMAVTSHGGIINPSCSTQYSPVPQ